MNFEAYRHQYLFLRLARNGRKDDALSALKTSISLDPTRADGWYVLATVHLRAGDLEEARDALSRAIQLDPEQPVYRDQLMRLGRAYYEDGRIDTALAIYDEFERLKSIPPR